MVITLQRQMMRLIEYIQTVFWLRQDDASSQGEVCEY
jgi:hypothetical protein